MNQIKLTKYITDRIISAEQELDETQIQSEIDFLQGEISALMELEMFLKMEQE